MMSFDISTAHEAFVWIWLPGSSEPVVAGKLVQRADVVVFTYGKSYLQRSDAISLFNDELPLQSGVQLPLPGLSMANCLRDASPDAWGRRVLMNAYKMELNEVAYLLASGSNRVGMLDFQLSAVDYMPRTTQQAGLEELLTSAERVEQGIPLSATLDQALQHGTSIGGARPKALLLDGDKQYVAKFSSASDLYNVIKAEYIAMRLATQAGLNAAKVQLQQVLGRDVLLVERFDRVYKAGQWQRKGLVSALTLLGLDEMMARYASYEQLAEIVRHRFVAPTESLHELFGRLCFNILVGNTDDHARNHAAFWDGQQLALAPAYDICPQARTGNEASQAMLIMGQQRMSQLHICLAASQQFLLSATEAQAIIERLIAVIEQHWDAVCDEAELSLVDRQLLWGRQFLNPYALDGFRS